MTKVVFQLRDGASKIIDAPAGQSLMLAARNNGIDIEGACDGAMACSTCHVVIDSAWYEKLPKPCGDEREMLDLTPGLRRTSRLACQIKLTADLEGIIAALPK